MLPRARVPRRQQERVSVNPNPPKSSATLTEEPLKHVIDQYVHRLQQVTCVCGWQGSSATTDGQTSEWTAHLLLVRGKRR
jgi:hypothetical protein